MMQQTMSKFGGCVDHPITLSGSADMAQQLYSREEVEAQVAALGPWFHNLDLPGVKTAPEHFLGDYPMREVAPLQHGAAGGPERHDRARYRLQRRLLLDRNEAARRGARARDRHR